MVASPVATAPYGPVFWWHGRLVSIEKGSMRLVTAGPRGAGRLATIVATGFPAGVLTVSSDATGDHLLLTGAPAETDENQGHFTTTGSTYRWDNGYLSTVPTATVNGSVGLTAWAQPGW